MPQKTRKINLRSSEDLRSASILTIAFIKFKVTHVEDKLNNFVERVGNNIHLKPLDERIIGVAKDVAEINNQNMQL